MFPNLEAEQARNRHTNKYVAEKLSLSRQSYEFKKRTGNFKLHEIVILLAIYNTQFDYLFATEPMLLSTSAAEATA